MYLTIDNTCQICCETGNCRVIWEESQGVSIRHDLAEGIGELLEGGETGEVDGEAWVLIVWWRVHLVVCVN